MKRSEIAAVLEKELAVCPADVELVDARLRRVYGELPEALPVKKRVPFWVKRAACTAASLLAAAGLLLGVNQVNPAFAESLPFVGSIFQSVNDRGRLPAENAFAAKEDLAGRSVEVAGAEGLTAVVPADGMMGSPGTAALKEVYYDGSFVFAGIEFQLGKDSESVIERWGPGFDFTINGKSQIPHGEDGYPTDRSRDNGFVDMSDYYFTNLGGGRYVMQKAFRVPDSLQGAESLDVELGFEGIEGLGGPFSLRFTARKAEVPTRSIDCTGVEKNGIRLVSAAASPTVTCIVVEYPESYVTPACWAAFSDGIDMGNLGGEDLPVDGGMVRDVEIYSGLREDEGRNLVWRLFDKNGSYQYEAVFVLDFQAGTAWVGSDEDLKAAPYGDYACGAQAIKDLTEGYLVEKFHVTQEKPMLWIATAGGAEQLYVEVLQDGVVLDSGETYETGWYDNMVYWEYGSAEERDRELADPETRHNGWMILLKDCYVGLDMTRPVTVRAYNEAGDVVLEEEINLEMTE